MYVPKSLPFELNQNMFDENANSMKLYVKRVFINDKFDLVAEMARVHAGYCR